MKSVLTIGLSPAFEHVLVFPSFRENEVNRAISQRLYASGKAINVARALIKAGRSATNITQLGGPRTEEFLTLATEEGIPIRYVETEAPIRTCTTVINKEKGTSTELVEETGRVDDDTSKRLFSLFLVEERKHDAVVISGTKAPGYSSSLIPDIVKKSSEKGKLTILDIKGQDLLASLKYHPGVIKPNLSEFTQTFGLNASGRDEDIKPEVIETMKKLYGEYGTKTAISRGGDSLWFYDGFEFGEIEIPKVKTMNTIGCGDTLTAIMTHFLLEGMTLHDALKKAVTAASNKAQNATFDYTL